MAQVGAGGGGGGGQGGGGGGAVQTGPPLTLRLPFDPIDGASAAEAWLAQVSTSRASYGWTASSTISWAVLQLTGEARSWVAEISAPARTDWTRFCDEFRARFCPQGGADSWLAKAATRRQAPTESADSYWRALRALLRRVVPPVPGAHAFAYFVAGLRPELRHAVKTARITDVGAALPLLRDLEPTAGATVAAVSLEPPSTQPPPPAPATVAAVQQHADSTAARMDKLESSLAKLAQAMSMSGGRKREKARCFVCGSREHRAHRCPRRFREDSTGVVAAVQPQQPLFTAMAPWAYHHGPHPGYPAAPRPLPAPPQPRMAPALDSRAQPPPHLQAAPHPPPPWPHGAAQPAGAPGGEHAGVHFVQAVAPTSGPAGQLALPLSVEGKDVLALVDSGSPVCLFNPDRCAEDVRLEPYRGRPLAGANDLPIDVVGQVTLQLMIARGVTVPCPALAVRGLSAPMLLGMDFLTSVARSVDIVSPAITLHCGKQLPLVRHTAPADVLFVGRVTVVPPLTTVLADTHHNSGAEAVVEPHGKLVSVAELGVVGCSGKVVVANHSPFPAVLAPGTPIGQVVNVWTVDPPPPTPAHLGVYAASEAEAEPDVEATLKEFGTAVSEEHRSKLRHVLQEYKDVFSKSTGAPSRVVGTFHSILASGPPIRQPRRRLSDRESALVEEHVAEMLRAGVIRPSESPWSSPVVLAQKKDGTIRFCVDYRRLNERTVKDAYPLPRIDSLLSSIKGTKIFSCLDLARGYWQVPIDPASIPLTAFATASGSYEFVVMPFGLSNAPPSFQRMMDTVLSGLEGVRVYLDDLLVCADTVEPRAVATACARCCTARGMREFAEHGKHLAATTTLHSQPPARPQSADADAPTHLSSAFARRRGRAAYGGQDTRDAPAGLPVRGLVWGLWVAAPPRAWRPPRDLPCQSYAGPRTSIHACEGVEEAATSAGGWGGARPPPSASPWSRGAVHRARLPAPDTGPGTRGSGGGKGGAM